MNKEVREQVIVSFLEKLEKKGEEEDFYYLVENYSEILRKINDVLLEDLTSSNTKEIKITIKKFLKEKKSLLNSINIFIYGETNNQVEARVIRQELFGPIKKFLSIIYSSKNFFTKEEIKFLRNFSKKYKIKNKSVEIA